MSMASVALSAAVAVELKELSWRQVLVAEAPTEAGVLKGLDGLEAEPRRAGAPNP